MLRIAKVLKSNGTDGGLLVGAPDVELQEITQEPVFIEFDGLPVPFFILDCKQRGTGKYIVHLNDVCSLEDAEELVGRDILFDGELEEDGCETFDGWSVYDRGTLLGTVCGFEDIPGNPCLDITLEGGDEVMVPLHEHFVQRADPGTRELHLDLPEGLY